MRKLLLILGLLALVSPAKAQDVPVNSMTASGAIAGTQLLYCPIGASTDLKCTFTQVATFMYSLMSGDCTATSGGAVTCTKTGGVAFSALATTTPGTGVATALGVNVGSAGAFVTFNGALGTPSSGTATNLTGTAAGLTAGNVTTNANLTGAITSSGNATSLGSFSSANLLAALTTSTGTGSAVFGTAPTISSLNATTALTLAFITGSTQCLHVNTSGVISGTGSDCGSGGSSGANPTATAGPTAVNGTATTFLRSDGAPAIQKASSSVFGIVEVDGTSITASGGVISATTGGSGTVTSVATACGATGGTITATGTIKAAVTASSQTGTNYAFQDSDCGKLVNLSNASNQVPTLAAAGSGSLLFSTGGFVQVCNQGAGTQTLTPTTSTIGGASTFVLPAATALNPACVGVVSDGTNYQVVPDYAVNAGYLTAGTLAAGRMPALTGDCTTSAGTVATTCTKTNGTAFGALATVTPGTNVATAAAVALSGAGGLTSTIASGTAALGTSAIASGACATVVTVTATNTATTDVVYFGYNGDPSAVTGYGASATGLVLSIYPYPTANNVNVKVCNSTASSITPGSMTLNWRVLR